MQQEPAVIWQALVSRFCHLCAGRHCSRRYFQVYETASVIVRAAYSSTAGRIS